jgi:hypothetical protein
VIREIEVAAVVAAIAVAVFWVGDRLRPKSWRSVSDEAAHSLVADLSKTVFTAVVAFVVVICWQQYQTARDGSATEADSLVDVYWAAQGLPQPDRDRIQNLVRGYTSEVEHEEWPEMAHGRMSPVAQATLDSLHDAVDQVQITETTPDSITEARATALDSLDKVSQQRQIRGMTVRHKLPGFLYVVLWFGTVLLLLNPVFHGIKFTRRSAAMVALIGVLIGSALLLIDNLQQPYGGADHVGPDAFQSAMADFRQIT